MKNLQNEVNHLCGLRAVVDSAEVDKQVFKELLETVQSAGREGEQIILEKLGQADRDLLTAIEVCGRLKIKGSEDFIEDHSRNHSDIDVQFAAAEALARIDLEFGFEQMFFLVARNRDKLPVSWLIETLEELGGKQSIVLLNEINQIHDMEKRDREYLDVVLKKLSENEKGFS